jgi:hypothetical protein
VIFKRQVDKKDLNYAYGDGGVSVGLSLSVLEAMESESSTTRTKKHTKLVKHN